MKNYPQIIRRVCDEPWLILPASHRAIQQLLASRLQGDDDEEPLEMPHEAEPLPKMAGASIVPVHGILGKHLSTLEMMCGGCSIDQVALELEAATEDRNTTRTFLAFNSPGGTYPGIPELARKIAQADQVKPVYAFIDPLCASGALWLASACREGFTLPSAMIGSVGVYSVYLDETAALDEAGIKVNAISAGKYKLMGASFKPMTADERAMLQAEVDRIHDEFKTAVRSRREVADEYLEGAVYSGEQAVRAGFATTTVDSIEEAVELTAGGVVTAQNAT